MRTTAPIAHPRPQPHTSGRDWLAFGLCAVQAWLGWRALRTLAALPAPPAQAGSRPPISVIIPARNEAARLPRLIESLRPCLRPGDELIVADDSSTDGTGDLARAAGACVVAVPPLPQGWRGKPWACQAGATAATNEWLLFLDADTRAEHPQAIDRLYAFARQAGVECASAFLRQELRTASEQLLVPFAYRHYLAGRRQLHTINGQCILIRRTAYERAGGHAGVRHEIAEDVAFARVLEREGVPYALADGRGLFSVRMYASLGEIREGFGKNAGLFLRDDPGPGALTFLSTSLAGWPATLLSRSLAAHRGRPTALAVAAFAADAVAARTFAARLTSRPAPAWPALAQPVAQALFTAIAMAGIAGPRLGRGRTWKGRALDRAR